MTWQHLLLPFISNLWLKQSKHKMSPPFPGLHIPKSFCWNPTLLFPPRCHTLSERLALMWLAAIQPYERNEQMSLFPPITIFHLALQSPLYSSTWSTFSLHFPFFSPDCNQPRLLHYIFKSCLEHIIMRAVNPVEILCCDKSNAAVCLNMQPNLRGTEKNMSRHFTSDAHPLHNRQLFFFLFPPLAHERDIVLSTLLLKKAEKKEKQ